MQLFFGQMTINLGQSGLSFACWWDMARRLAWLKSTCDQCLRTSGSRVPSLRGAKCSPGYQRTYPRGRATVKVQGSESNRGGRQGVAGYRLKPGKDVSGFQVRLLGNLKCIATYHLTMLAPNLQWTRLIMDDALNAQISIEPMT